MAGRSKKKKLFILLIVLILAVLSSYAVMAGMASNRVFSVGDHTPYPGYRGVIADKEVNENFTVYVFVANFGGEQTKDTATNVRVSLIDDENGQTLRTFPSFDISRMGYHALTMSYNQPARVHFQVTGMINGKSVTTNSMSFNIGNPGDFPADFYLEAYMDSALTQPLNAEDADSTTKLKAGQTFYIKITARNADGTVNTATTYNTPGQDNVTGTIGASDEAGEDYDADTFPSINSTAITDIAPGVGRASAVFYDVGIIRLDFANSWGVPSSSGNVGRFYPDHFAITSDYGVPLLQIRGDIGSAQSSLPDSERRWGYIGEPMNVSFDVGAYASNGQLTENYTGEFAKFNNSLGSTGTPGWGVSLAGSGGEYTSRLTLSSVGSFVNGTASLRATLTVGKNPAVLAQEQINNFVLTFNPADSDGVTLTGPVQARVLGSSGLLAGPYDLYGGRIHVLGGYYTQSTVAVPVKAERWDGQKFILNTFDSHTGISEWSFTEVGGPPNVLAITGTPFTFADGSGGLTVMNNGGSEIERTLGILPGSYPGYLDFHSESLAWGQIVEPGGPQPGGGSGIIWEKEQLP